MFDIITKQELWQAIDDGVIADKNPSLKNIQDGYILHRMRGVAGQRVVELGGGNSRVLPRLAARGNECWNVDRLEGLGNGPLPENMRAQTSFRLVRAYMGDFSPDLPASYFDYVISISAVEHIPIHRLEATFADCARVLKLGGRMIHVIDVYLFERDYSGDGRPFCEERIAAYLKFADRPDLGIRLAEPPVFAADATFRCQYATNSDFELYRWNKVAKGRVETWRAIGQNCSIRAEWIKPG